MISQDHCFAALLWLAALNPWDTVSISMTFCKVKEEFAVNDDHVQMGSQTQDCNLEAVSVHMTIIPWYAGWVGIIPQSLGPQSW